MITVCCGKRKKAPHVCSCRAFLRRNSCRAASLSQFLRGGAFGKKPLSRYLLRLRLVLRRAGGNGGLGDVVRMIADVLDDPENIHIDKARFGVAFLLRYTSTSTSLSAARPLSTYRTCFQAVNSAMKSPYLPMIR